MDAGQLQDCGGEVHDGVDAGKLLQDLQAHTCSSSSALLCESMSNTVWGSLHLTQMVPRVHSPYPSEHADECQMLPTPPDLVFVS